MHQGKGLHQGTKVKLSKEKAERARREALRELKEQARAEKEKEILRIKQARKQRAFNKARAEMVQKVTNSTTLGRLSARQKREIAKRTEVLRLSYFGLEETAKGTL